MTPERKKQIFDWIKIEAENLLGGTSYKLFIFGSQANREILSNSDIDVGIESKKGAIDDSLITRLWNKLDDLPTLYSFDVVDFATVDEKFKKVAMKNIEILHDGF
jgi:predicted nucleotidyltransferase